MLQPDELEHVLACYRDDVGTLRRLLGRANVPLDTGASLEAVGAKLRDSRRFRRDLSLHIVSMAHMSGQNVSPADLLGMVALAAAGPAFAPGADHAVAHTLLQFLIEVCDRPVVQARPAGSRNRFNSGFARLLGASVLCLLLIAIGLFAWMGLDPAAPATALDRLPPSWVDRPRPTASTTSTDLMSSPLKAPEHLVNPVQQIRHLFNRMLPAAERGGTATVPSPPSSHEDPAPAVASNVRDPGATTPPEDKLRPVVASSLPISPSQRGTPTSAIPTAILSQRLGSRSIPPDSYYEDRSDDARTPRLLRRTVTPQLARTQANELVAAMDPPPSLTGEAGGHAVITGTVHPVLLGIMAGNILYSPAPAYPTAASAAHIQGEVRVQAEVDRDGNVASARAISGPPLLRDAAVDAVQRWRYKPFTAAGKAMSMTSTAVVEFELP